MAATGIQPDDRTLGAGWHTIIRTNREAAQALPAPDTTWYRADAPAVVADALTRFRKASIVHTVAKERHNESYVHRYRTSPTAYTYAQSLGTPPGPCDHTGVRCLDAEAGVYTCTAADCNATFDRAVAERRVGP